MGGHISLLSSILSDRRAALEQDDAVTVETADEVSPEAPTPVSHDPPPPACPRTCSATKFPDLCELPAEIGLEVLKHLNATDLCLAACVWQDLAEDELLWQGLCRDQWGYATVYGPVRRGERRLSYRHMFMLLDEGQLSFNGDAFAGIEYLFRHDLVADDPAEIAMFLHNSNRMDPWQLRRFLDRRRDVLSLVMDLQNYRGQFLPVALRKLFTKVEPPEDRGNYLHTLLEKFSVKFCQCNPRLGLSHETVYILCFSLIMLSVDLSSPHVKNKMSKREFIRNVRQATAVDDEMSGHLYDDIYLRGHVAALGCR